MGDIWNKMNEEMSKPRFSGYDIAGAVVPGVAAAQGAKSAFKKYKAKKEAFNSFNSTASSNAAEGLSESMSSMSQMAKKTERPMQKPLPRASKPKIDLRKSYPE
jgi:hypothetical protein